MGLMEKKGTKCTSGKMERRGNRKCHVLGSLSCRRREEKKKKLKKTVSLNFPKRSFHRPAGRATRL